MYNSGQMELWWENGILPPLPPDGCRCEVALTVARTFGVAEGGGSKEGVTWARGKDLFVLTRAFLSSSIPSHSYNTRFFTSRRLFFFLYLFYTYFSAFYSAVFILKYQGVTMRIPLHCENKTTSKVAPRHRGIAILTATAKPPLGITSTAPWFRYPHCGRPDPFVESLPRRRDFTILTATNQTPFWNHFHDAVVWLSSLWPTKPIRGITSPASRFRYPHCGRPNPSMESLPQCRGFTILTATDQTPWFHIHGATDSLLSLWTPKTPPWNHFHGAVDPLPRIFLPEMEFVRLAAAVTFHPSPYSPVNRHVLTGRPACFSTTPNCTPFPPTTPRAASLHHC